MINLKQKSTLTLNDGSVVPCQEPIIVSASRSTDIPAFYCDWFFHRLNEGYSVWTNPFNGVKMYVSYAKTRFIVFWSKNPRPLLKHLDYLEKRGIKCYIQYSLNDYEEQGLEKNVRPLAERIETFKLLVNRLGVGSVIWRFDPLILTDEIDIELLLRKIQNIGDKLKGSTKKLVFSFADIEGYKKVKNNLIKNKINYSDWTPKQMEEFAKKLSIINKERGWNYELATCGEQIDIDSYGISHNRCIDGDLITQIGWKDKELMSHMRTEIKEITPTLFETPEIPTNAIKLDATHYFYSSHKKDPGQRAACGCMAAKDIGEYNTCIHMCEYCYANTSTQAAIKNYNYHKINNLSETITGK